MPQLRVLSIQRPIDIGRTSIPDRVDEPAKAANAITRLFKELVGSVDLASPPDFIVVESEGLRDAIIGYVYILFKLWIVNFDYYLQQEFAGAGYPEIKVEGLGTISGDVVSELKNISKNNADAWISPGTDVVVEGPDNLKHFVVYALIKKGDPRHREDPPDGYLPNLEEFFRKV